MDGYSYDVFGGTRAQSGASQQPFLFTGEQGDDELRLIFLRARYYDPEVGRFISRDSFPGFDTDTQSLNRYVYVNNNPALLTDPSGEIANFIIGGAIGAAVGLGAYAITTWATGGEFNAGHALVATGSGALMGAALPLVAAGMASGAIAPGALGTALGVKGSVALVGAELGLAVGVNKSILNQQLDNKPIDWSKTVKEGAIDMVFGGWSGYGAGSDALKAVAGSGLQPGGWSSAYNWSKLPKDVLKKLSRSLMKSGVKSLWMPDTVYAPSSSMGSNGGDWGGPPSGGK